MVNQICKSSKQASSIENIYIKQACIVLFERMIMGRKRNDSCRGWEYKTAPTLLGIHWVQVVFWNGAGHGGRKIVILPDPEMFIVKKADSFFGGSGAPGLGGGKTRC